MAYKVTKGATARARRQPPGGPLQLHAARARVDRHRDRAPALHVLRREQGQDGDAASRDLLVDAELWFVPVANPDGYDFTFTDGQPPVAQEPARRQRRRPHRQDGDGVDPNRNFPTNWNYDDEGSSPDPRSETYRGTGPASEPETQAMGGLMKRIKLKFQINYHSFAQLLLYPEGWQVETPTTDDPLFVGAGRRRRPTRRSPGFDPDLSAELYTTNGESPTTPTRSTAPWPGRPSSTAAPARSAAPSTARLVLPRGFVFQDYEADVQAEFEKNLAVRPRPRQVGRRPGRPGRAPGQQAPDFVPTPSRSPTATRRPSRSTPSARSARSRVYCRSTAAASTTRRPRE